MGLSTGQGQCLRTQNRKNNDETKRTKLPKPNVHLLRSKSNRQGSSAKQTQNFQVLMVNVIQNQS